MLYNCVYVYDFYNYYFFRDVKRFDALKYAYICVYKFSIFFNRFIEFFN